MSDKPPEKDGKPERLVPSPVNEKAEEREKRLAEKLRAEHDTQKNMVLPPLQPHEIKSAIDMDEQLDPAQVEENCSREPWLLSPVFKMAAQPGRYGIVPERYEYQAMQADVQGDAEAAALNRDAMKRARAVYNKQIRADFKMLANAMDRKEIGMFAQSLWETTALPVKHENAALSRFFDRAQLNKMDGQMTELARARVYMMSFWMAMVINEIPVKQRPADYVAALEARNPNGKQGGSSGGSGSVPTVH
ncbi:MAG: hypothetical protein H6867_05840 [Rhodospirillales bacterium]|nr:hypothetical protein [Rhodospirillales bacterium]MCB9995049.1 hypothetical protein [Rhodospirillales bacterium]